MKPADNPFQSVDSQRGRSSSRHPLMWTLLLLPPAVTFTSFGLGVFLVVPDYGPVALGVASAVGVAKLLSGKSPAGFILILLIEVVAVVCVYSAVLSYLQGWR